MYSTLCTRSYFYSIQRPFGMIRAISLAIYHLNEIIKCSRTMSCRSKQPSHNNITFTSRLWGRCVCKNTFRDAIHFHNVLFFSFQARQYLKTYCHWSGGNCIYRQRWYNYFNYFLLWLYDADSFFLCSFHLTSAIVMLVVTTLKSFFHIF